MQYPFIHRPGNDKMTIVARQSSPIHQQNTAALPASVRDAAQRGWQIFPIFARSKYAMGAASMIEQATTDLVQLEAWADQHPGCNWAVATGQASGVLAVEMDGAEGVTSFTFLVLDNQSDEMIENALTSRAGHGESETICVYFRWPADLAVRHVRGAIAPGLRLRGEGDYV